MTPGALTCSVGDMAPGMTHYVYLIVQVAPDAPAQIVEQAVVQSGFSDDTPNPYGVITPDPCPADNIATTRRDVVRDGRRVRVQGRA